MILSFLGSAVALGQADPVNSGPPAPNMSRTPPELSLPIDSGLLVLLIAGLGYGIYSVKNKMKARNSSQ